ncbi:MAG: nucleotide exchange factor GrpE [Clostridiales bacterium]|nr:nucleotide exchange factor GrpE [Clostridiales bacterium]
MGNVEKEAKDNKVNKPNIRDNKEKSNSVNVKRNETKDNHPQDENPQEKNLQEKNLQDNTPQNNSSQKEFNSQDDNVQNGEKADGMEVLRKKLDEKTRQCEDNYERLQRAAADFDNYRKRTIKEKSAISVDTAADVVQVFLPVLDNLDRALRAAVLDCENGEEMEKNTLREGVTLVYKQFADTLKKLGVEEIVSIGSSFDPQIHHAVMHINDESYGEGIVIEELQKGYILGEKVIRHSMVKVAN